MTTEDKYDRDWVGAVWAGEEWPPCYKCKKKLNFTEPFSIGYELGKNNICWGCKNLPWRQEKRADAFNKHKEFLDEMVKVKKGTRYRKWLYRVIKAYSNTVFETEEEEYKHIGKYGRGMWHNVHNTFKTKKEKNAMILFAEDYGGFDY
jgi:hypothetical protein|tara:strand:- start:31 stop:474 length:444 start_codon:yes stop_codon:yes gene_type:complete